MNLTPQQIHELLDIIEKNTILFISHNVSTSVLSEQDRAILKIHGVDINKIAKDSSKIYEAYKFGMLSSILKKSALDSMNYQQLKDSIKKLPKLNSLQEKAIENLQFQTYQDVKKLSEKMKSDIYDIFVKADKKNHTVKHTKLVTDAAREAIEKNRWTQEVVSILGKKTGDWDRDLGRIADYVLHGAFDEGRLAKFEEKSGEDSLVYKDVYPGACKHCQSLYLTGGIGSEPRLFSIKNLRANATNIGRKVNEWLPVVGALHPYCFDEKTEVLTNQGWKLFRDVTLEEKFLSLNLETESSEWVGATKKIEYLYKGTMHQIKSRDFDSLTTPNHRHVIEHHSEKKLELREGSTLPKSSKFLRTIPKWKGSSSDFVKIGVHKFKSRDWFEFMGWYIAEGSLVYQEGNRYEICITQSKEQYKSEIREVCRKLFNRTWEGGEDTYIPITEKEHLDIINYLKGCGNRSWTKELPEHICESSKELIEVFLLSYYKGDGTFDKSTVFENYAFKGQRHFYTSSEKLSAQIGELLLKIGKKPSYTLMKGNIYEGYQCRDVWKISEGNSKFTLRVGSDKIDRLKEVHYSGMVYDVELEKYHTLFVRRNGRVWVSGNCRCTLEEVPKGFTIDDKLKGIWFWNGQMFEKDWDKTKEHQGRKVERKSKVKVTVNKKEYEV